MEVIRVQSSKHILPGTTEGRGTFAARDVSEGEVIVTLGGSVIDFATTQKMGEAQCYALQFGRDAYYDLAEPLRWSNHSCNPNCGIRNNTLVALRSLPEGEEITWDYSTTMDERFWTMQCTCGEAMCRGIVDDFRTLPQEIRQRYLRFGIVMPFIAAQYTSAMTSFSAMR